MGATYHRLTDGNIGKLHAMLSSNDSFDIEWECILTGDTTTLLVQDGQDNYIGYIVMTRQCEIVMMGFFGNGVNVVRAVVHDVAAYAFATNHVPFTRSNTVYNYVQQFDWHLHPASQKNVLVTATGIAIQDDVAAHRIQRLMASETPFTELRHLFHCVRDLQHENSRFWGSSLRRIFQQAVDKYKPVNIDIDAVICLVNRLPDQIREPSLIVDYGPGDVVKPVRRPMNVSKWIDQAKTLGIDFELSEMSEPCAFVRALQWTLSNPFDFTKFAYAVELLVELFH